MADQLGSLVISLIAETATARSEFEKAAQSISTSAGQMAGSLTTFSGLLTRIDTQVQGFGLSLRTLGGLAAAGGLGALVTNAVSTEAAMLRLAQRAGDTVSSFSALVPAAKTSDTAMEEVASASAKLSKNLAGAGEDGNTATKVLTALGFTSAQLGGLLQSPSQAMQDIAQKLDALPNSGIKAAAAMALFGKSGEQILPFLHDLAEQGPLVATITDDQAAAANRYEAAQAKLQLASAALGRSLGDSLLPALTGIASGFAELNSESSKSPTNISIVGEALIALGRGGLIVETVIKDLVAGASAFGSAMKALATGDLAGVTKAAQAFDNAKAQNAKALLLASAALDENSAASAKNAKATTDAGDAAQATAAKVAAALKAQQAAAGNSQQVQAIADFINKLTDQVNELGIAGTALTLYKAQMFGVESEVSGAVSALQQWNEALAALKETEASEDAERNASQAGLVADATARIASTQAVQDAVDALNLHTQMLGLDNAGVAEATLLAQLNATGLDKESDAYRKLADAIHDATANNRAQQGIVDSARDATRAWQSAARDIDNALTDALYDGLFVKGKSFGEDLRDSLQQMFKRLVLQPLLQPIAGSLASLATGFFPTGAAAQGIGGAGSLLSSGGSILGGLGTIFGGAGTAGGNFLGGVTSSLAGIGSEGVLSGIGGGFSAGFTALGAGNIAGGLGSIIGAGLPIAGLAALAISLFGGSRGGPKGGGFGSVGNLGGLSLDADNGRFYTPSDADATLATLAQGTGSTFSSTLAALGGTGSAGFAFGYDTDPNGKAPSRLSVGASVGGRSIYSVRNQDEGSGTDKIEADLPLYAQRAILAALQASDLPSDIAHLIDSVDASTASSTTITNLLAQASALKSVTDILAKNPVEDALAALAAQSDSTTSALTAQITASQSLIAAFDHTAASSQGLVAAAQSLYAAEVSVIAQAEQVKKSLGSMFGDSVRQMTLSTLDDQGKYNYYQRDEKTLMEQLSTATSADQVNSIGSQIFSDFNSSFSLLSPAQQKAQLQEFIKQEAAVQAAIDKRLMDIETQAQTDANKVLDEIKQILTDNSTANKQAADTQQSAANTNLQAAKTPITINLNLDGSTGVVNS